VVTLELPYPPTANTIWRRGRGRTYLNPKYKAWQAEANGMFMQQKAAKTVGTPIVGPFEVHLTFSDKKRRKGSDLDNRVKPVLDQMQKLGVIENDSLAEKVTACWGPVPGVFIRAFKHIGTSSGPKSKATLLAAG
jgi:crossover junction endodeoxyribonuclease RusA